ncbi:MAG: PTS sugar transporter subunit IIA [Treponema sp.]|jgi:mannitol/fructose-specific phosphotransferase system IIA component (Ntr-type)|nr:PTS sugar transporter subunit IIA [Treponema sp.]
MLVCDVFSPDVIRIDLEAHEKEEVFEELVDQYCHARKSRGRERILEAIHEREMKMSTDVKTGIAIPHGKTDAVRDLGGALGISHEGIDYGSPDKQPVHLLFMIIAPLQDSEKHLRLLKRIAEFLEEPTFYRELLEQKSAHDVYNILKKYEDIFIARD